ncbi:UDP-N-acetylmuramoyl-tripeptide--D-alanyl-D-alanine ligase [Proteiniborus sp. MB09-C3]|uniref:UDP-N-acetylmuramoyl-tripeptide--D-alanyl-D- alanine ligase n=1 Tax=Proteiniborus sp. MB09-C3 TaxID=3050072 RepID=UPI002554C74F|nr:UDP-N-acetylmuramoyl-tripeptide--D-alanyl-D-alanine ligase [Proteiniborus sp. MB09-C3]WIV10393.1 UDP-N-acetylmuramoyl-tripeptide--D-alanyl-D-alanine ligase [Proteiniborus sp. MB09-C3]
MLGNNSLMIILAVISVIIWNVSFFYRSRYMLHMMQLEGYLNESYLRWIKEFQYKVFSFKINIPMIVAVIFALITLITGQPLLNLSNIVIWSILTILSTNFKKENVKKDLVYTKRAQRLLASMYAVNFLILIISVIIYSLLAKYFFESYAILLLIGTILYYFAPYTLCLANILVKPIEEAINKHYYDMARDKVRSFENLKIVGITGSYGKTSAKFITAKILEEKFNVLKTPESYNTPMGVSKVINNTLNDEYNAFVVEMGARNIGEIKEMADLAGPKIGVITSIGPTHLETFINIDNIMKTKYELIEALPPDGIAIFNYDNQYLKKLADKTFKEKILYGTENTEFLDIYATNIEVSELGSTFILNDKNGNSIKCETKLLGSHNIGNLLAGACIGVALGLTFEEIARGIKKVEPVPHRLQLINPGTGVIIIDDAFNSNPVSSKAALDVISQFKEGRKIIVTPGMVELGQEEEEANRQFGRYVGDTCDFVILVGKNRTKPIYEGIFEKDFNKNNVFVVSSLNEATAVLQKIVRPKDVVLFENDLPDTYNE